MKFFEIAAASAVLLSVPMLLVSCNSAPSNSPETEIVVPVKEPDGKNDSTEAVEVKPAKENPEQSAEAAGAASPKEAPEQSAKPKSEPETHPAPVLVPEQPAEKTVLPPESGEKKITLPCDHVVHTGDNLWKLARRYYGEGSKWKLIYEANRKQIKKENFLEPGKILRIPAEK